MAQMLLFSVLCAVLGVLIPVSAGDGMKRGLSFLAGLAVLLTAAQPAAAVLADARDIPEKIGALLFPAWEEGADIQKEAEARTVQQGIRNAETGIESLLRARWHLSEEDVHVQLSVSRDVSGDIVLDCVDILLPETADIPQEDIERYIHELFMCPCRVVHGEGQNT